ncbi:MAG: hypothetical protein NTY64_17710, partial [Deltaproteobacteria bacterium]|nr:hypothetical protein [Deltaproteobacteria bacterium]
DGDQSLTGLSADHDIQGLPHAYPPRYSIIPVDSIFTKIPHLLLMLFGAIARRSCPWNPNRPSKPV